MRERILWIIVGVASFFAGAAVMFFIMPQAQKTWARWFRPVPIQADIPKPPAVNAPELSFVEPVQPVASEYQEIIDALRGDFIDSQALLAEKLSAQTLPPILSREGSKVRIFTQPAPSANSFWKPKAELLPNSIVYWRLPNFSDKPLAALLNSWNEWKQKGIHALIIDLRFFQSPNDFAGAADVASLFAVPNTPLFTVEGLKFPQQVFKSERQPLEIAARTPVIVLVNPSTRGAAEALADFLRRQTRAILVGQSTAGEAGFYTEKKMASGRYLRVATGEVVSVQRDKFLGTPLMPDIISSMTLAEEAKVCKVAYEQGVSAVIYETKNPPRPNEAALVQGRNVEMENAIAAQLNSTNALATASPQDLTLKTALDVASGVFIYYQKPSLPGN